MLFQQMYVIDLNDVRHLVNLLVENEEIQRLNHQNIIRIMIGHVQRVQYEYAVKRKNLLLELFKNGDRVIAFISEDRYIWMDLVVYTAWLFGSNKSQRNKSKLFL